VPVFDIHPAAQFDRVLLVHRYPRLRQRTDRHGVFMAPEAYRQLKELAAITGKTQRDLMSEAITRLAVAHDQPVDPELRQKFRRIALGLE
jgi:hypothetical protein